MSSTLISRRYETKSLLLTTNRPFSEWPQVFPNATCVISLIDRIIHHAEMLAIDGESYRAREARERAELCATRKRKGRRP
jgi:DNA replication protein DnaC